MRQLRGRRRLPASIDPHEEDDPRLRRRVAARRPGFDGADLVAEGTLQLREIRRPSPAKAFLHPRRQICRDLHADIRGKERLLEPVERTGDRGIGGATLRRREEAGEPAAEPLARPREAVLQLVEKTHGGRGPLKRRLRAF